MLRLRNKFLCINIINKLFYERLLTTNAPKNNLFPAQYCANLVKTHDYENYLCTLLLEGDTRRYAFAIRALNVEISKIPDSITDDTIGKMKLKFWHDSIEKCFEKNKPFNIDHPVIREIQFVLNNKKLSKMYLKRLVTARDRPFNSQFQMLKEIEDYSEQTVSSIYYILLETCDIRNITVDHAASHLGKAQGITNLLRAIPHRGAKSVSKIPLEMLLKHGVSQEKFLRSKGDFPGAEECIFEIASLAHQHLEKARNLIKDIPLAVRSIFLPAVAVGRYLERLRMSEFKLYANKLQTRDHLLPLAYYWNKLKKQF